MENNQNQNHNELPAELVVSTDISTSPVPFDSVEFKQLEQDQAKKDAAEIDAIRGSIGLPLVGSKDQIKKYVDRFETDVSREDIVDTLEHMHPAMYAAVHAEGAQREVDKLAAKEQFPLSQEVHQYSSVKEFLSGYFPQTEEEFIELAKEGKLRQATGKPAPFHIASDGTALGIGLNEGYPPQDIAKFYQSIIQLDIAMNATKSVATGEMINDKYSPDIVADPNIAAFSIFQRDLQTETPHLTDFYNREVGHSTAEEPSPISTPSPESNKQP